MSTPSTVPATTLEIRSTVTDDGSVTMTLGEADVRAPADHEVTVRIEAAPINPSDLGTMIARADVSTAQAIGGDVPGVRLDLSPAALAAQAGRVGKATPCGNEGGGVVVAAGSSDAAQALLGRTVGFVSGNTYAEYRTIAVDQCFPMHEGTTSEQAAAPFVNPLTALGMVETMRDEGHTALVHTVGVSNLGLMLNRLCQTDGVDLVNIVRRPEQAEQLRSLGAEYVVDSSADSFHDDLVTALTATGATIAFDAIGGGELASTLLSSMEQVASSRAEFKPLRIDDPQAGVRLWRPRPVAHRAAARLRHVVGHRWLAAATVPGAHRRPARRGPASTRGRRDHDDVREFVRRPALTRRRGRPRARAALRPHGHRRQGARHPAQQLERRALRPLPGESSGRWPAGTSLVVRSPRPGTGQVSRRPLGQSG